MKYFNKKDPGFSTYKNSIIGFFMKNFNKMNQHDLISILWYSGASAHMTPFKNDCTNIQPTYKMIYLADGSSVLCKHMGNISIPISKSKKVLGSLILRMCSLFLIWIEGYSL